MDILHEIVLSCLGYVFAVYPSTKLTIIVFKPILGATLHFLQNSQNGLCWSSSSVYGLDSPSSSALIFIFHQASCYTLVQTTHL